MENELILYVDRFEKISNYDPMNGIENSNSLIKESTTNKTLILESKEKLVKVLELMVTTGGKIAKTDAFYKYLKDFKVAKLGGEASKKDKAAIEGVLINIEKNGTLSSADIKILERVFSKYSVNTGSLLSISIDKVVAPGANRKVTSIYNNLGFNFLSKINFTTNILSRNQIKGDITKEKILELYKSQAKRTLQRDPNFSKLEDDVLDEFVNALARRLENDSRFEQLLKSSKVAKTNNVVYNFTRGEKLYTWARWKPFLNIFNPMFKLKFLGILDKFYKVLPKNKMGTQEGLKNYFDDITRKYGDEILALIESRKGSGGVDELTSEFKGIAKNYQLRYLRYLNKSSRAEGSAVYGTVEKNAADQCWKEIKALIKQTLTSRVPPVPAEEVDKFLTALEKESNNDSFLSIEKFIEFADDASKNAKDPIYGKIDLSDWTNKFKQLKNSIIPSVKSETEAGELVFKELKEGQFVKWTINFAHALLKRLGGWRGLVSFATYGRFWTLKKIALGATRYGTAGKDLMKGVLRTYGELMLFKLIVFPTCYMVKEWFISVFEKIIGEKKTNPKVWWENWVDAFSQQFVLKTWADYRRLLNPFSLGPLPGTAKYLLYKAWYMNSGDQELTALERRLEKEYNALGLSKDKLEDVYKELRAETDEERKEEIGDKYFKKAATYAANRKVAQGIMWKETTILKVEAVKIFNSFISSFSLNKMKDETNKSIGKRLWDKVEYRSLNDIQRDDEILKYQEGLYKNPGSKEILSNDIKQWVRDNYKPFFIFKNNERWELIPDNPRVEGSTLRFKDNTGNLHTFEEFKQKLISTKTIKQNGKFYIVENNMFSIITNKLIKEMNEGKKFGEDNFKHWKDTFKFKKYDEKTNQLKDVKITSKMDEIMDRINHFRKKYDEDDAFVRAVIDVFGTGVDIIQYTKGLAHLSEGVIVKGLMSVLANLRETKELVTWTVKHYKDGNWELVKGNFNKKELLNVGKTKRERDERQKESENPAEGLKKKEQESMMILSRDEKEGLNGLPTKVKQKVKEKLRQGWTTEKPFEFLNTYYSESEINSVFNDKIKIYKLKPSAEFFRTLSKNSSKITMKKGFCKSLKSANRDYDLNEKEKNNLNHFISKCESKFGV